MGRRQLLNLKTNKNSCQMHFLNRILKWIKWKMPSGDVQNKFFSFLLSASALDAQQMTINGAHTMEKVVIKCHLESVLVMETAREEREKKAKEHCVVLICKLFSPDDMK